MNLNCSEIILAVGEKKFKDIKFKDLDENIKEFLRKKLVNSWSQNGYAAKINNRIRVREDWRANYDCGVSENCSNSASITVSADGLSHPVVAEKTRHTCNGGGKTTVCEELIDAKQDMMDLVTGKEVGTGQCSR